MRMEARVYYYAARIDDGKMKDVPSESFNWLEAAQWDIAFLIHCRHRILKGIHEQENGNRYYVHTIAWEDFDMLRVFGVECVTEFTSKYPT